MPKPILLIIYLLLSTALLFAQKETKKYLATSFSPGIVPVPGRPLSLRPGIEIYFSPKLSLFNEISLQTGKNKDFDSTAINKKYFRYKAEIRFYWAKVKNAIKPYLGLQFTGAKRKFDVNKSDRYYETFQDDSIYTYNKASINSPVKTGTLQLGLSSRVFKDFYLDTEIGFGFKFINTDYSSLVNLQKIKAGFLNIKPISSYRYIGKLTRLQFNLGFCILYKL
ncbi:MAG TPA: hypothetical protein VKC90_05850 [Chitinophagaceae bacterium]|nr:hypothetical protein [Chitinophagaceae bacterium]